MFPSLDIVRVLEAHGADYVPHGHGWRAMRCPYHDDRTASASVNTSDGAFTCHACGVKGDGYALIRHVLGVDDWKKVVAEAQRFLSESDDHRSLGERPTRRRYVPPGQRRRRIGRT